MTDTPPPADLKTVQGYPGRERLNAANSCLRRALARLYREAVRHDRELLPRVQQLAGEAAETLERLAAAAEAAEDSSARHQAALKAEREKLERIARKAARTGSPRARQLLERIERRHGKGVPPDAA